MTQGDTFNISCAWSVPGLSPACVNATSAAGPCAYAWTAGNVSSFVCQASTLGSNLDTRCEIRACAMDNYCPQSITANPVNVSAPCTNAAPVAVPPTGAVFVGETFQIGCGFGVAQQSASCITLGGSPLYSCGGSAWDAANNRLNFSCTANAPGNASINCALASTCVDTNNVTTNYCAATTQATSLFSISNSLCGSPYAICGRVSTAETSAALDGIVVQLLNDADVVISSHTQKTRTIGGQSGSFLFTGLTPNASYRVVPVEGRNEHANPRSRRIKNIGAGGSQGNFTYRGRPAKVKITGTPGALAVLSDASQAALTTPPPITLGSASATNVYETPIGPDGLGSVNVPSGAYRIACWTRSGQYTTQLVLNGSTLAPDQSYTTNCPQ